MCHEAEFEKELPDWVEYRSALRISLQDVLGLAQGAEYMCFDRGH